MTTPSMITAGVPVWAAGAEGLQLRFVGRGPKLSRLETLRSLVEPAPAATPGLEMTWLKQIHAAGVVEATDGRSGQCGEGDALWTKREGMAVAVATADCVPVVLGRPGIVAAVHAGWRGIVAGVVAAALEALGPGSKDRPIAAWIGPSIGGCCYEVGDDVAERVVSATAPEVAVNGRGAGDRPHLDLRLGAEIQLRKAGVSEIHHLGPCTRCSPHLLWSYRRDGARAGRNLAIAWLG